MHMQDGIGRSGYRALSGVFFAFGLIGLGTTLYAFRPSAGLFDWLGFGFSSVAFLVLFTLTLIVLRKPFGPAPRTMAVKPKPAAPPDAANGAAKPPATAVPVEAAPKAVNFEFADAVPAAGAAPTKMVLPPAFQGPEVAGPAPPRGPKDPKAWPDRRPPAATRKELAARYTQNAPVVGDIIASATNNPQQLMVEAPVVLARTLPNAQAPAPAGMAKGRCGGCSTILVAPRKRPLNLRCPRCDKVTLLK